jgi:hypothetical protein
MSLPATVRVSLARYLAASDAADKTLRELCSAVRSMVRKGDTTTRRIDRPSHRASAPTASGRVNRIVH